MSLFGQFLPFDRRFDPRFAPSTSVRRGVLALALLALLAGAEPRLSADRYGWLTRPPLESLSDRVKPPSGFFRQPLARDTFGSWLRGLPVLPGNPNVRLWNGERKRNQSAQHCVLMIDVGTADLQQCADAVIRLRAEYLYSRGCEADIAFHFTSGDIARWIDWREGLRPRVEGNRVSWERSARRSGGYESFRRYLDTVFTYAGSASLAREVQRVADPAQVEIGDLFIQGGFPGHAVLVVDVVESRAGERRFLLAQSFMPAQEIHVLKNPGEPASPWYRAAASGELATPEWTFQYEDLRRFPAPRCRGEASGRGR